MVRALVYHEKGTQFDSRPLTLGVSAKEMMIMGEVLLTIVNCHTVTKPYAGFRLPDRRALDSTVRGGEHFLSLSQASILHVHSFMLEDISGIFRKFTL